MLDANEYVGKKIIVYNIEKDAMIAETEIMRYEKKTKIISLRKSALHGELPNQVSVLIFTDRSPHEFFGTVHRQGEYAGQVDIGLYKGKAKEERATVRYPVKAPAVVEYFVLSCGLLPLPRSLAVVVLNISSTGCLLRGDINFFNIGTTVRLKVKLGENEIMLDAKVVRIAQRGKDEAEYGCQFVYST